MTTEQEQKILQFLKEQHGLRRLKGQLAVETGGTTSKLCDPFQVSGTARATDGRVLGIVLSAGKADTRRLCIAPFQALREPKQLATYLEDIGLVPPSNLRELKLLASYIVALGGLRSRIVLGREGIHHVAFGRDLKAVAVVGQRIIGAPASEFLALPSAASRYSAHGDLAGWKADFKPMLRRNPLLLLAACFALAVPLGSLLGFPLTGLLLAGASSTGKTTLARFVTSTYNAPLDPHQWSGTANGIEALASLHADLPLSVDELGAGDIRQTLAVIYRVNGGQSKARATITGQLQHSEPLRCAIFATGEATLNQQATVAGANLRAGHDVRMPTIWVDEAHGVYSDIADASDGAEFAERVSTAMQENHGVLLPAFLEAVLGDLDGMRRKAQEMRPRVTSEVAGVDVLHMTGVERRVLTAFTNWAIAGELAVASRVLPLKQGEATAGIAYVFGKWLSRWRELAQGPSKAPLRDLSDFFKRNHHRFVPLDQWQDGSVTAGCLGFRQVTDKYGERYLLFRDVFEKEAARKHGVDACVQALRDAGLLITGNKGRTLLVRMPRSEQRMGLYAIRAAVMFDSEE